MTTFGWRHVGVGSVCISAVAIFLLMGQAAANCSDIDRLVRESATDFAALRGEPTDSSSGEWTARYDIDGASSCSIIIDPERALYLCTWEHAVADGTGPPSYEAEVNRVRSCVGDGAKERQDASVNHPDFWASTHFSIPGGEVSVSRKDKGALGLVLVTIGADHTLDP